MNHDETHEPIRLVSRKDLHQQQPHADSVNQHLRLGRPPVGGLHLPLGEMNTDMIRYLNLQHRFHARCEQDRYEQMKAGLPLSHF